MQLNDTHQQRRGYGRIVAGLSLHQPTHPAVVRAVSLARAFDAWLGLVHLIMGGEAQDRQKSLQVAEQFEELQALYPEILGLEQFRADNMAAMLEVGSVHTADLMVIGSHAQGRLRELLGVHADQLLHRADHDLLLVKSDLYAQEPPMPYRRVLGALDLGGNCAGVCARAAELAIALDAELGLLHLVEHFGVDRENTDITPEDRDPLEYQKALKTRLAAQIFDQIGLKGAQLEVLVSEGGAASALNDYAAETGADLIVIGAGSPHRLARLIEPTMDRIVHKAPCDVLVVKKAQP